jgi:formylglycine-generating enzyme required for sulfatase activity
MKKIVFFVVLLLFVVSMGYCSNESFVIKELNLELIKCPAGRFMMGSPEDEIGGDKKEKLHLVTITKPFYIGKYEVTQSQYSTLMDKNPSKFIGANNPVEMVSYDDAKAFCDKMNLKYLNILPKGYKFDLPTEAQWEYACRAGTNTSLNNGKNLTTIDEACLNLDEIAWYTKNSGKTTHEVGQKKPNAWGIYDMHGNVCEWCRDWYGEYPKEDVIDPTGANSGSYRVCRGGSWSSLALYCRSADRGNRHPVRRNHGVGFRLALVPIN